MGLAGPLVSAEFTASGRQTEGILWVLSEFAECLYERDVEFGRGAPERGNELLAHPATEKCHVPGRVVILWRGSPDSPEAIRRMFDDHQFIGFLDFAGIYAVRQSTFRFITSQSRIYEGYRWIHAKRQPFFFSGKPIF